VICKVPFQHPNPNQADLKNPEPIQQIKQHMQLLRSDTGMDTANGMSVHTAADWAVSDLLLPQQRLCLACNAQAMPYMCACDAWYAG
jgi:hypothetical protein